MMKLIETWQTLIAGVFALVASLMIIINDRFNEKKHKEMNFFASKAFLPPVFAELSTYLQQCGKYVLKLDIQHNRNNEKEIPVLFDNYRDVFRDCIRYAPDEVGRYLSNIVRLLQIQNSRMKALTTPNIFNVRNRDTCLFDLAELQALINLNFAFVRDESDFINEHLKWESFENAYRQFGIFDMSMYSSLKKYTKNKII